MRVLLINPFYPISETPSPPLGLAFLGGVLEQAGCEVRLLDCVVTPYSDDRLASLLQAFRPQVAGATAVSMTVDHALTILQTIKALDPSVTTVIGGPHATFCAESILEACPRVDAVARGEGEISLIALIEAIAGNTGWSTVPGIVFRRGRRRVATALPPPVDLDRLPPPARHLVPLGRYRALGMPVSMTTSRGCPHACIFCVGRKMVGARVRYRDPVSVVDEMAYLSTLGFHQINLADDLFTSSRRHCRAVCDEILRRGLTVRWTSFARVDSVSRPLLTRMRRAGCTTISFGVESGSPEMLARVRKGITLDQVVQAVTDCRACGIDAHASFILGLPGETRQTLETTLAFGERLRALGVNHGFHILAPFPGTEVRERIAEFDLQILSDDWQRYHANRAVVRTADVPPEALDAVVLEGERRFDRWLGEIGRLREAGETRRDVLWPLIRLEHTVVVYDMMMQRVVEEAEPWPAGPAGIDEARAVDDLVRRAADRLDHPRRRIREAVEFAVREGHLARRTGGGAVRWSWVEELPGQEPGSGTA